MLKRYIQAGILNFLTPQQIANQGSYRGKFLGGLTDLVAIIQSYFTAGLITVTGANVSAASTSASGVVELATTAETQTGSDSTRAITAVGATATFMKKYTASIAVGDWVNGGANSTFVITAATHKCSKRPIVTLYTDAGTMALTLSNTVTVDKATGDVTITILTADIADAIVVIV